MSTGLQSSFLDADFFKQICIGIIKSETPKADPNDVTLTSFERRPLATSQSVISSLSKTTEEKILGLSIVEIFWKYQNQTRKNKIVLKSKASGLQTRSAREKVWEKLENH